MNPDINSIHELLKGDPELNHAEYWYDFPGDMQLSKYKISTWGQILQIKNNLLLSGKRGKDGYQYIILISDSTKSLNCVMHRLVALVFIPKRDVKCTVDHIDRNKINNHLLNLRWLTPAEQNANRGPIKYINKKVSVDQLDLTAGTLIKSWESIEEAAKQFDIKSPGMISLVCSGKLKSAKGFGWRYSNSVPLDNEIWKEIPGFNMHEISNLGRIKKKGGRILSGYNEAGYLRVGLIDSNNTKTKKYIHQLICLTFNGDPPINKKLVNHIDGNKLNNVSTNLEWCNTSENTLHAYKNNFIDLTERNKKYMKPVIQYDLNMVELARFAGVNLAEQQTGSRQISKVCKQITNYKTAGGYIWRYA
jgi:hypothetical protein